MKGREAMKKAAAVLLALCLIMSAALADDEISISPDLFADVYNIASKIYGIPPLGEMKTDLSAPNARYWETDHERVIFILGADGYIKGTIVAADLSSRVFLNVCFCVLQAVHGHSFTKEDKGLIIERYFMTNLMPEGYWSLNDQVMYQFVFSESENVMNVYVN